MSTSDWQVAQVNIALLRAPTDFPHLQDFVSMLEPINALADGSPGFVWRPQTETGDATGIRAFDDDRIIVNLSVWETIEALGRFVFASRTTRSFGAGAIGSNGWPRPTWRSGGSPPGLPRPSRSPSDASRRCVNAARPRTPSRSGSRSRARLERPRAHPGRVALPHEGESPV